MKRVEEQEEAAMSDDFEEREGKEEGAGPAYPDSLRAALVADLEPLVRHVQAVAGRDARTDPEAEVMRGLNVPRRPGRKKSAKKG
jgi:hypothetical protein